MLHQWRGFAVYLIVGFVVITLNHCKKAEKLNVIPFIHVRIQAKPTRLTWLSTKGLAKTWRQWIPWFQVKYDNSCKQSKLTLLCTIIIKISIMIIYEHANIQHIMKIAKIHVIQLYFTFGKYFLSYGELEFKDIVAHPSLQISIDTISSTPVTVIAHAALRRTSSFPEWRSITIGSSPPFSLNSSRAIASQQ